MQLLAGESGHNIPGTLSDDDVAITGMEPIIATVPEIRI